MQTNDILRHKKFADVEIRLVEPKGNGYKFVSPTHKVKGMWPTTYIESDFEVVTKAE